MKLMMINYFNYLYTKKEEGNLLNPADLNFLDQNPETDSCVCSMRPDICVVLIRANQLTVMMETQALLLCNLQKKIITQTPFKMTSYHYLLV